MSSTLDRIAERLELGGDATKILEPLRALYERLGGALEISTRGLELPCRAGCDACCHESVFLSAAEMLGVAEEILSTRSSADRAGLVTEMRALAERFAEEIELLDQLPAGPERDEVAARIKFRCPLLGGDGCCTVYRSRELNARTFGQTIDRNRGEPYGCELTHQRLRVLGRESTTALLDARDARRELVRSVPNTAEVRVFPDWFERIADLLIGE